MKDSASIGEAGLTSVPIQDLMEQLANAAGASSFADWDGALDALDEECRGFVAQGIQIIASALRTTASDMVE